MYISLFDRKLMAILYVTSVSCFLLWKGKINILGAKSYRTIIKHLSELGLVLESTTETCYF